MMSSRTMLSLGWVLGCTLLLSACGGDSGGEDAPHKEESAPMPVQDSAFGDMVGTMDRARGVEATDMEHKEAVDRAIEQNTGSTPAE